MAKGTKGYVKWKIHLGSLNPEIDAAGHNPTVDIPLFMTMSYHGHSSRTRITQVHNMKYIICRALRE